MRRQRGPGVPPTRFLGGVRMPPAMAPPTSKQSLAPPVKTRNNLVPSSSASVEVTKASVTPAAASDITAGDDDLFLVSY